jgi:transcriptional regulator with XRE-family HTH domain
MAYSLYPEEVAAQLRRIGENIKKARIRRRWSKEELATRIGVERRTIARLETGSPGITAGVLFSALWVLGLQETAKDIAIPELDKAGEFLDKQREPKRVRNKIDDELDF